MTPAFPAILQDALARDTQENPAHLTRPIFVAAITYLALAPRTQEHAAHRTRAAQVFAFPKGPDWTNSTLTAFLSTYSWHFLFAHSPEALDLIGTQTPATSYGQMPPFWHANLQALEPGDMDMVQAWSQKFRNGAFFSTLLMEKLGDRRWDTLWTAWLDAQPDLQFPLPGAIITHPAICADPEATIALLSSILPRARWDGHIGHDALDSWGWAILMGNTSLSRANMPLQPSKDLSFPLQHSAAEALCTDMASDTGKAALMAAFPTPRAFWEAGAQGRNAYLRQRVFSTLMPSEPPRTKAPGKTPAVTKMLNTHVLGFAELRAVAGYEQRCREALAGGQMAPKEATKVQHTLDALRAASPKTAVTLPASWKPGSGVHYKEYRTTDPALKAIARLGASGHTTLADTALDAYRPIASQTTLDLSQANEALLACPTPEGLDWLARNFAPDQWARHIPSYMKALPQDPQWPTHVLALADAQPRSWIGTPLLAGGGISFGFLSQGGPWLFADVAHRQAWLAKEASKPRAGWDISPKHLQEITQRNAYVSKTSLFATQELLGVLRLSLALRDQDAPWLEAFGQASQHHANASGFTLLARWNAASAHQRLALTRLLKSPEGLLAMEHEEVLAKMSAILD